MSYGQLSLSRVIKWNRENETKHQNYYLLTWKSLHGWISIVQI